MDEKSSIHVTDGICLAESSIEAAVDPGEIIIKTIRRLQERASVAPIVWPNEHGAFAGGELQRRSN